MATRAPAWREEWLWDQWEGRGDSDTGGQGQGASGFEGLTLRVHPDFSLSLWLQLGARCLGPPDQPSVAVKNAVCKPSWVLCDNLEGWDGGGVGERLKREERYIDR